MVVVHLIPESLALAGPGNAWKASTCVLAGFSAALLVEHLLNIYKKPLSPSSASELNTIPAPLLNATDAAKHHDHTLQLDPTPDTRASTTAGVQLSAQPRVLPPAHPTQTFYTPQAVSGYDLPFLTSPIPVRQNIAAAHSMVAGQRFGSDLAYAVQIQPVVGSAFGVAEPSKDVEAGESAVGKLVQEEENTLVSKEGNYAMVFNIVLGDFFHNFFDGVAIAIAFKICGTGPRPATALETLLKHTRNTLTSNQTTKPTHAQRCASTTQREHSEHTRSTPDRAVLER